ncbi:MAG: hypothetical protein WD795_20010 [Woeseia sp.]
MEDVGAFIDRHRIVLLRYLDGKAPESAEDVDALSYVDAVLNEWHERFGTLQLAEPEWEERTFWFALYQLEELAELPGHQVDPYEKILMGDLAKVRELLRNRQPLPDGFMATRPNGT